MIPEPYLEISLTPGPLKSRAGIVRINEMRGGPETLLYWLETQLGLPIVDAPFASRVSEFAAVLDRADQAAFSGSLQIDRWATATELLSRHDELLLAGWRVDGDANCLPAPASDLARCTRDREFAFPGIAERLAEVIAALDAGQTLPPHRCALVDSLEIWPKAWQTVLQNLTLVKAPDVLPHASEGSALLSAQRIIRGGAADYVKQDDSLRHVHTRSQSTAVEFVTATLTEAPDKLASTVILCEDDELALRLDACFNRVGLPTMGVSAWSRSHPVLQVLPLALALCWEPVNPQILLDFLTLPAGPLPRRAASDLAAALGEQPGLGSSKWNEALSELCSEENDPEGDIRRRIDTWLHGDRVQRGSKLTARFVRERCGLVAQWATGRATLLAENDETNPASLQAYYVAAGQASLVGELAECQGQELTDPQLARLVEEALASGVEATPFPEAEGGPTRIRSLAEIDGPCDRLIWLGLGTEDARPCRWPRRQLNQLRDAGVDLDDGSTALSALRSAEARGFCSVRESLLTVLLPQDREKRWHPLWLAARRLLPKDELDKPIVVEDLITRGDTSRIAPYSFQTQSVTVVPAQPLRPMWSLPADLLHERDYVSASELQDRLACPLKWTLRHQAKLYSSSIAELPSDFLLKGNFCHSVLEQVFGDGGELLDMEVAVEKVRQVFDERLPLDAAPLAQPAQYLECQQLRSELEHATRVLVGALRSGGYRIVGLEMELQGRAFGTQLRGWIDCLAERDGQEAIIDFKYGGRSKYREMIQEGKAVQLATYAYARSNGGGSFPAIAYLILADGMLITPSGSPLEGDGHREVIDGPSVETVWRKFSEALEAAGRWLVSDDPVPARPLQDTGSWPDGAEILLDPSLKAQTQQNVCKYCDYMKLCGLRETW